MVPKKSSLDKKNEEKLKKRVFWMLNGEQRFHSEWMDEWMTGWMNGRVVDGWMDEWMNGWVGELMDEWMNGWMRGWMNGWVEGWMDEWEDEWMDRWMDEDKLPIKNNILGKNQRLNKNTKYSVRIRRGEWVNLLNKNTHSVCLGFEPVTLPVLVPCSPGSLPSVRMMLCLASGCWLGSSLEEWRGEEWVDG